MTHPRTGNLALAIVSLGFFGGSVSAYAIGDKELALHGIGRESVAALAAGDFSRADRKYYRDYVAHPDNPLAIFNVAVSLRNQNRIEEAHRLFSQAALLGQNYTPDYLLGAFEAPTIRAAACMYLAQDGKSDPNCPDLRAELVPPASIGPGVRRPHPHGRRAMIPLNGIAIPGNF